MDQLKEKAKLLDKIIQASDGKELTPELAKQLTRLLKQNRSWKSLKKNTAIKSNPPCHNFLLFHYTFYR